MSKIKALEKLRALKGEVCDYRWGVDFDRAMEKLEAEIEERYMELPIDADGVPIRPGDVVASDVSKQKQVWMVSTDGFAVYSDCSGYNPKAFSHVKPRALEDVLKAYYTETSNHMGEGVMGEITAKYAAELRELMGGDA